MSKEMTPSELSEHIQSAISQLHDTLNALQMSNNPPFIKRAMLLGYWIKTYVRYLRHEDSFSPHSVYRLKRGSVISVEFGYRVGRELGGIHYAIVLDVNNSIHTNTVTVVPLNSQKPSYENNPYYVPLEDGIFAPMMSKLDALTEDARKAIAKAAEMDKQKPGSCEDIPALKAVHRGKTDDVKRILQQYEQQRKKISRLKPGSVANISQITTISKMRIVSPLKKTHPLYGIRVSARDLDKIDAALKERYFPPFAVSNNEPTELHKT